MKRIVITGASGMLGVALISLLAKEPNEITAVIRPGSTRRDMIPPWWNLRKALGLKHLNFAAEWPQ